MYPVKVSTALTVPVFAHDVNGDAVTGLTDGSFTKRISKNGAAFAAMTVTITELENGWYSIPLSSSHTDTLGLLSITFTNGGAKQINLQFRVHARIPDDLAFPNTTGRGMDITAGGTTGIDWANVENPTTALDLSGTDIQLVDTATAVTNDVGITATAVDDIWDELLTGALHNTATSAGRRLRETSDANQPLDEGTAQGGAAGSITLAATADAVNDDIYEDAFVSILSGTGAGQVRFITSYTASTRVALVHENWIVNPDATSAYDVHGSAASNVHAIADSTTAAMNLLADYDGTGYNKSSSTVGTTTTNTDMRGTDSALLAANTPTNFSDLSITVTTGLVDVTQAAADKAWSTATRVLTAGTNLNDIAAGEVWAVDATTQQTQGTFGQAIGDPVADTSTIWGLANTNLDATVSSRSSHGDPDPSGFLDAAITSRSSHSAADVWTSVTRVLTAAGIPSGGIAAAELNNIADALLDRRLDLGTDTGGNTTTSRTWRQALRTMRNRVAIAGGTMTVYEEDDTTSNFTGVVTTSPTDPIQEINPA